MSSLPKLEDVLQSPIVQLLYCKFEEIYNHVKGLTSKLDALIAKLDANELTIATLRKDLRDRRQDPEFDFGSMHLGS